MGDFKVGPNAAIVVFVDRLAETVEIMFYAHSGDVEGTLVAMNGELDSLEMVRTIAKGACEGLNIEYSEEEL